VDADDLSRDLPEEPMSEPWKELQDKVLSILLEETKDFSSELKESAELFMRNQAASIAREKWRQLNAESEEERKIAESNLRHLHGQIGAEIARMQLVATERAGALMEKVISTTISLLLEIGPKLLMGSFL
jgi:hypothetical protein